MIKRIILLLMFLSLLVSPVSADDGVHNPGDEIRELRGRSHKVYQGETPTTFFVEFVGSPEFTQSADGAWIEYDFSDYDDHYKVQHPWCSVAFYDYYTVVYDETFTEVKIYDDRWIVEYQNKQGRWTDASFWGVVRSYEMVSDGIKLKRIGDTTIGQREEIYYFRDGSPCKIEIRQDTDEAQTIRFAWKPSGIVASSERNIIVDEFDKHAGKTSGLNYYSEAGDFVYTLRWYDELAITESIVPVVETYAQGRKATVTFGDFVSDAGDTIVLDPDTFYPDAHVETSSVDGQAQHSDASGLTWTAIVGAAGNGFQDSGASGTIFYWRGDGNANKYDYLKRGIYLFDTSGLPDDATITAAVLSIYGTAKGDEQSDAPEANIYSSNPASNTALENGDFDCLGTTEFATAIAYADWSEVGYNDFTLNVAGKAAISKTSISKFGLREAKYDVAEELDPGNHQPNWGSGNKAYISGYYAEEGTGFKPKLVITYTTPPPPPPPSDPRDPDLVYLELRPDLSETKIAEDLFVPSNALIDIFHGYSLPVWNSDNETLHYLQCVPERWDGSSNIIVCVKTATSDDQSGNAYELELAWDKVTPNVVEAVPTGAPTILSASRLVTSALQYACHMDWFELDYDIDPADPVVSGDTLGLRFRRFGAADNLTSELIVFEFNVSFARGDLLGEEDEMAVGIILIALVLLAMGLTVAMFVTRNSLLGFPCVIMWIILGGYAYTESTTPWGDWQYYLFFASAFGMTIFCVMAAFDLRKKRETFAESDIEGEEEGEGTKFLGEEAESKGNIDAMFSTDEEKEPSRRRKELRERADKRRTGEGRKTSRSRG